VVVVDVDGRCARDGMFGWDVCDGEHEHVHHGEAGHASSGQGPSRSYHCTAAGSAGAATVSPVLWDRDQWP
jgi:hypothetical protein